MLQETVFLQLFESRVTAKIVLVKFPVHLLGWFGQIGWYAVDLSSKPVPIVSASDVV